MAFELGIARSQPVAALRIGLPSVVQPGSWRIGEAVRYPIGWFDYAAPTAAAVESSDADSGDGAAPKPPGLLRTLAAILQPPLYSVAGIDNVLEWPAPLLPFQRMGVATLLDRPALLLADSMGLGKTIQAIAAMRILFHRKDIASALVVCPASLIVQWRRELLRWAPELSVLALQGSATDRGRLWRLPAHVRLVGYETLRADVLEQAASPALKQPWGVIVLDEASRIKNPASGLFAACTKLPGGRRWALTGTPVENSADDAAALLDFLLRPPGAPATRTDDSLSMRFRAHVLRRRREDVLPELPAKRIHEVSLELRPAQRASYDRAEQDGIMQLSQAGDSVTIVHVLELISRLKQICNFDPRTGESCKVDHIKDKLGALSRDGRRALVFSQFTDDIFGIGRLSNALIEFRPLEYTGEMSPARRNAVIEEFVHNSQHKALLLSLRAGGQGLNLQAASCVFHLDRWWNPAVEEQAESRSHRLGQTGPVTIYRYTCVDTIEERIDAKLRKKREVFQEFVDDTKLDIGRSLTESELFDLFGLTGRRRRR